MFYVVSYVLYLSSVLIYRCHLIHTLAMFSGNSWGVARNGDVDLPTTICVDVENIDKALIFSDCDTLGCGGSSPSVIISRLISTAPLNLSRFYLEEQVVDPSQELEKLLTLLVRPSFRFCNSPYYCIGT